MRRGASFTIAALVATPVNAHDAPFDMATAVPEAELAEQRGGMTLPNGIDIALTAQIDTARDGTLILRSVLEIIGNTQTVAVYAPAPGHTGPAFTAPAAPVPEAVVAPQVVIDQDGRVATATPGFLLPVNQVSVGASNSTGIGGAPEGLTALPLAAGAPAVQTAAGLVTLTMAGGNTQVVLDGPQLDIVQLLGGAFGTVTANMADNTQIESATLLSIELSNTEAVSVANRTLQVQDLVLDTVRLGIQ